MTTYAQLKSDIAAFAARDDLTVVLDTFIDLVESDINMDVRTLEMETDVTLTLTSANGYAEDLPTGFLGFKSLYNSGATDPSMSYLRPETFHRVANAPSNAFTELRDGKTRFTIESNKIKIDVPDGATEDVTIEAVYYKDLTGLSDSNASNDLLGRHYGLYLYGALSHAFVYIDDTEQEAKYTAKYNKIVQKISGNEVRKRRSPTPRQRRVPAHRVA